VEEGVGRMSNEIDKEAQAYSDAYHALAELKPDADITAFGFLSYTPKHSVTAIRRVLLALSSRFKCELTYTEPPPPPPTPPHKCDCDRCDE